MFCAIYEFLLNDADQADQLRSLWRRMTMLMKQKAGAIGSRLHSDDENPLRFIAYSQWPDRQRWAEGRHILLKEHGGLELMQQLAVICDSKVICESSQVEDLLSGDRTS